MTETKSFRTLSIVGPGRVGHSIARAAVAAGIEAFLVGRAQPLVDQTPADVAIITVPDTEIASCCEYLCRNGEIPGLVGHTSGATGLDALAAVSQTGTAVFSMHPLQTFADRKTSLAGQNCAVTSDSDVALERVSALARELGMRPFKLDDSDRPAYHAAASIASNFLIALEESAAELLSKAGIEHSRELLSPLVLRTAQNWTDQGANALTGPIARGDEQTVDLHVETIAELSPELLDLYAVMAERTRTLAAGREPSADPKAVARC